METRIEDYERRRVNCLGLTTATLRLKRFIKASNCSELQDSQVQHHRYSLATESTGEEIREFYEDTVRFAEAADKSNPAKSTELLSKTSANSCYRKSKVNQKPKISFDKNKFFLAATQNDASTLEHFHLDSQCINSTDQYGWSALMMATCEDAFEAVQFLLRNGADPHIADKKGNNAFSLSVKKGFARISELLQSYNRRSITESSDKNVKKKEKANMIRHYCVICERNFTVRNKKEHETSTLHLFNMKSEKNEKFRYSTISNKNRGLQLMVKQGWDRESGLGPHGSGKLYPVKTVIRKNRTGLGIEQESARVTHFKPYDLDAIKHRPEMRFKSRNEMRREQRRNQKIEKRLRNELA